MQLTEPQVTAVVTAAKVGPGGGAEAQLLAFEVAQLLIDRQPGERPGDRRLAIELAVGVARFDRVRPTVDRCAASWPVRPGLGCSVSQ